MNALPATAHEHQRMFKLLPECTCCGKVLTGKLVWLEMNQFTGKYQNGGVPEDQSQGWHVFGTACAKRKLKERRS
jgi:hypothetical protein